jgi:hypothetical protein
MDAGTGGQIGAVFIFLLFSVKGAGDSGEVKGNVFPFDDFFRRAGGVKFDLFGDAHALKDRREMDGRKRYFHNSQKKFPFHARRIPRVAWFALRFPAHF